MQIITDPAGKELKKHGDSSFPFLVSYERLSGYETGSFLWHWHPEIELTYIEKGEMLYKINQNTFHLKEGQAIFGNANALHAGYMYQDQDCQYIPITFDPKLIYGFSGSLLFQKYTEPILRSFSLSAVPLDLSCKWHSEAIKDIRDIIDLDSSREPMYEFEIIARLQHFWKILYENTISRATLPSGQDEENYRRIRQIMSYIAEHYSEKILLNDVSDLIHLSPSECSRLFKKCMNITLFGYIQEYRIERSLEYLENPSCSITGMVLEFSVPAAVISLMWVSIYNGNSPLSLSLVVIDTILAPFLIPAVLKLLVGSSVKMDTVGMMKELVFMIALPAVLAMCLNEVSHGKVMETWPKKLAPFSKMCLIFVVTSNSSKVSPYMKHLNGERLEVAAAILVLAAGGYAIGWIIAILTRQNKEATVSMIYGSGMRNISAGAVIAGAYFPAETLFPVMIGTLFQQILAAFYGSMMRRVQTGQQEREKEHGVSA